MLEDEKIPEKIKIFFSQREGSTLESYGIEMKPIDENLTFKLDFDSEPIEDFEQYIKNLLKENLGLIENPTDKEIKKMIQRNAKRKPKGKTVFFKKFIDNFSDSDIIDAEIIKEPIKNNEF